ncbi:hypothetical protein GCM10009841_26470 [Microlunatus panaciterrae]|uniref:N-acetyltransferase domain-containing protein n=1 Tax=Microlunatus panaciterrae TaxID=400768 RepID=A0ABS2RHJ4_9ACTN|nr:hypothetical protein [Microlunatus panaciterrae]MBM7798470.1 hypothetical protein [Microlunatus panaciterrae]
MSSVSPQPEPAPRRKFGELTKITVESEVSVEHAEMFYQLYLVAFEPLRHRAVARQVLHRDEFFEEMHDPRVWKYVAWDDAGQPIGLTTLTKDLSTVPWISPEYFTSRYPEHAARDAIYYLGFTLADPRQRLSRLFFQMLDAVVGRLVDDRAVCAYDVCAYNNESMRFGRNIELALHRLADVDVETIDAQTYYRAEFR